MREARPVYSRAAAVGCGTPGILQTQASEYSAIRARVKFLQEQEAKQPKVHIVRMRGLPFQAKEDDIKAFFAPAEVTLNGIFMPRVSHLRFARIGPF